MIFRRAFTAGCLGFIGLLAVSGSDAQSTSRPGTFTTGARIVLVPFTVTDHSARTVDGLNASDFKIFDDQAAQQILSFSKEDAPSSIGLVLDVSGSMQRSLNAVKEGSRAFVRSANPADEFVLCTVSTLPAASPGFTSDFDDVERMIASTTPGGFTALIDTVYLGLNQMKKARNPQRALIVLSDGIDNHSRYSRKELLRVALEADIQIYSIIVEGVPGSASNGTVPFRPSMIAKPWDRGPEVQGPELLEKLADKTGGMHFRVRSDTEVKEALTKTGDVLRNEYVIGYRMPDSSTPGKWHQVHVKTTVPKVHINARSGYYAP